MTLRLSDKLTTSISLPQEGVASFIRKTYELLEEQSHLDIVSWSDDGNFIVIKDLQKFTQRILPVYFKHNKMNSFIRQLNMYNFRKKRTMNSYHVYFNDLFKRGKVELLPLIKRKISDSPSSPVPSEYQSSHSYNSSRASNDLSYENMMLKKINQKAVSKINTLEAKIADLVHENKMLFKKISEKQKKEEYLHSTYSHCYPPVSQPALHQAYPQPMMNSYAPCPTYAKNEVQMVQMATPETDYTSSPDTFLSYENEVMNSVESTEFHSNNRESNNFGYEDDTTFLGKRAFDSDNLPWEEEMNLRNEPVKLPCFGLFEESEDKRINLLDPEFPSFSNNNLLDGVF